MQAGRGIFPKIRAAVCEREGADPGTGRTAAQYRQAQRKAFPREREGHIYIIMYIETDYRCITLALISLVLPTFQKFSPK